MHKAVLQCITLVVALPTGKKASLLLFFSSTGTLTVLIGSNQIVLTWNNGDASRSSQVTITCTPGQPDSRLQADTDSTGDPEHPSLHYNFKWSSGAAWACPQAHSADGGSSDSGGLSGGWIVIIVYVLLLPMAVSVLKVTDSA